MMDAPVICIHHNSCVPEVLGDFSPAAYYASIAQSGINVVGLINSALRRASFFAIHCSRCLNSSSRAACCFLPLQLVHLPLLWRQFCIPVHLFENARRDPLRVGPRGPGAGFFFCDVHSGRSLLCRDFTVDPQGQKHFFTAMRTSLNEAFEQFCRPCSFRHSSAFANSALIRVSFSSIHRSRRSDSR